MEDDAKLESSSLDTYRFVEESDSVDQPLIGKKVKFTKKQWITLILLAVGHLSIGASLSVQAPFFPLEAQKKGMTSSQYGLVFGAYQLTIFIVAPFIGKVMSRTKPKFVVAGGMLVVGVASILFGMLDWINDTTTFVALAFTWRIVEGIGAAAEKTAAYCIVVSEFSDNIAKVIGIIETSIGVGIVMGPTIGGVLYDAAGFGFPFYTVGSLFIVDFLMVLCFLPNPELCTSAKTGNMKKFWFNAYTLMCSFTVFTTYNYFAFNAVSLDYHVQWLHPTGTLVGLLFATSATVYGLLTPLWGWLCDKQWCDGRVYSIIGCCISLVGYLLLGPMSFLDLKQSLLTTFIAVGIGGAGAGAKVVPSFLGCLRSARNRGFPDDFATYGMVSSMFASSQSFGAFIGPSVGGYILEYWGYMTGLSVCFTIEVICAATLIASFCTDVCKKLIKPRNKEKIDRKRGNRGSTASYGSRQDG